MRIETQEILQGQKYNVNGKIILANSHFDAVRKWLEICIEKSKKLLK